MFVCGLILVSVFMDPLTFQKNVLVKYPFFGLTLKLDMPKIIIIIMIIIIIIIIVIRLIWICPVHSLLYNPYN